MLGSPKRLNAEGPGRGAAAAPGRARGHTGPRARVRCPARFYLITSRSTRLGVPMKVHNAMYERRRRREMKYIHRAVRPGVSDRSRRRRFEQGTRRQNTAGWALKFRTVHCMRMRMYCPTRIQPTTLQPPRRPRAAMRAAGGRRPGPRPTRASIAGHRSLPRSSHVAQATPSPTADAIARCTSCGKLGLLASGRGEGESEHRQRLGSLGEETGAEERTNRGHR